MQAAAGPVFRSGATARDIDFQITEEGGRAVLTAMPAIVEKVHHEQNAYSSAETLKVAETGHENPLAEKPLKFSQTIHTYDIYFHCQDGSRDKKRLGRTVGLIEGYEALIVHLRRAEEGALRYPVLLYNLETKERFQYRIDQLEKFPGYRSEPGWIVIALSLIVGYIFAALADDMAVMVPFILFGGYKLFRKIILRRKNRYMESQLQLAIEDLLQKYK